MLWVRFGLAAAVLGSVAVAYTTLRKDAVKIPLPTGRFISPTGQHTPVGSFPANMILSPDGKYVLVTNVGAREQLSVLDSTSGQLVSKTGFDDKVDGKKQGLYFGVACTKWADGKTLVAASLGALDQVAFFWLSTDGQLAPAGRITLTNPLKDSPLPLHLAGVSFSDSGKQLLVVANQSHIANRFTGGVAQVELGDDLTAKSVKWSKTGQFPLAVASLPGGRALVTIEGSDEILGLTVGSGIPTEIHTGDAPTYMILEKDRETAWVSNSNGDTIASVDTRSNRVKRTVLLRPGEFRGLPGSTPLGLALTPDEKTLFVAMGDMNAVAVVDALEGTVQGYIPVGWYPTSVVVSPDGKRLFVANAKGTQPRNPNGKAVGDWGQYIQNIIEGSVSTIDLPKAMANLKDSTAEVLGNNLALGHVEQTERDAFENPGIKHVIYVIKENRTYDQVFGDLKQGNGDPSLCLFPREVTPNQHALAERFALLDNFYVCAEVSYDGWNWSTSGMANAYVERNVVTNYSGRGRSYDAEGTVNGTPVELLGIKNVGRAPGGFIWDSVAKAGLTYRNYGFMITDESKDLDGKFLAKAGAPALKALQTNTCLDFPPFDMTYADSEAWIIHDLKPTAKQVVKYGSQNDPSRISSWLREFRDYVKSGDLPAFQTVRICRDHTAGTSAGLGSPRAMVADNDYAVGQLVEAVSHSPFWKDTVICILEDDAQAGFDHVDSHRSPALIISPYIEKATIASRFYNTDSMLRTMELLLGLKPMNQYDATARPIAVFGKLQLNNMPFNAILPAKEIIGEENKPTAYRAKDSARFISLVREESMPDIELNDILWGSIKGAHSARPKHTNAVWSAGLKREDD